MRNALSEQPLLDLKRVEDHEPAEALKLFLRQTLAPLAKSAKLKRYLRVFAWEQLKPTPVRARLSRDEPFPTVLLAEAIVRRVAPEADAKTVAIATAWLMGQTTTFIRDADWLAQPPLGLKFDRTFGRRPGAGADRAVPRRFAAPDELIPIRKWAARLL